MQNPNEKNNHILENLQGHMEDFDFAKVTEILKNMPHDGNKIAEYYASMDSETYEMIMRAVGFNDHHHIADAMEKNLRLSKSSKILDLGCGTGIMGRLLNPLGFTEIDGMDATEHFVETSKASGFYKNCHEIWLGQGIEKFPEEYRGKYDITVGSGVYMKGHFPKEALQDHVEATRVGGVIIFGLRDSYWQEGEELGFKDEFNKLIEAGKVDPEPVVDFKYMRGIEGAQNSLYGQMEGRILAFTRL